jgi:hypothetical protein
MEHRAIAARRPQGVCPACDGRSINLVRPEPIGYHRNGTEKPTYGKRAPFVQRCIVCQGQPPGSAPHGAVTVRSFSSRDAV